MTLGAVEFEENEGRSGLEWTVVVLPSIVLIMRKISILFLLWVGPLLNAQGLKSILEQEYTGYAAFEKQVAEALKTGDLSTETALEASFFYMLKNWDFGPMESVYSGLKTAASGWNFEKAEQIKNQDLLDGMIHLLEARLALDEDDVETFKQKAGAVTFEFAQLSGVLGRFVSEYRAAQALAGLKVDMTLQLLDSQGNPTSLAALVEGYKGILIDFWASWCGPCMAAMPELIKKAERYPAKGLVVVGMNTENQAKAEQVRLQKSIEFPWLVEPDGSYYSELLKIRSIPRMVLLDVDGTVHYNGHPLDPSLSAAIERVLN